MIQHIPTLSLEHCSGETFYQRAWRLRAQMRGRSGVERLYCPTGDRLYLKVMPGYNWRSRMRNRLRPAEHSRRVSTRLEEAGVLHSRPVHWGRLPADGDRPTASFVVTEEVQGIRLDKWLQVRGSSLSNLEQVSAAMGCLFGRLYRFRIHHQDPLTHNFILQDVDSGSPRVALIDLEGLYPMPLIPRAALFSRLRKFFRHSIDQLPEEITASEKPSVRTAFLDALQVNADLRRWDVCRLTGMMEEIREGKAA